MRTTGCRKRNQPRRPPGRLGTICAPSILKGSKLALSVSLLLPPACWRRPVAALWCDSRVKVDGELPAGTVRQPTTTERNHGQLGTAPMNILDFAQLVLERFSFRGLFARRHLADGGDCQQRPFLPASRADGFLPGTTIDHRGRANASKHLCIIGCTLDSDKGAANDSPGTRPFQGGESQWPSQWPPRC